MVHVCAKFHWRVPLYYGGPKIQVREGLKEGSEFFSLRYIVSNK